MSPRGLSLVELLTALAIGSFLIVGAVTLYVRSSAAYAVNETVARLQETARFALDTLEPDVQLAGYWGLTNDALQIKGALGNDPLTLSSAAARCGPDFPLNLRRPVQATNNDYLLPCAASGGGAQGGADVLISRHAKAQVSTVSSERLQVYTTRDGSGDSLFRSSAAPAPIATHALYGPTAEIRDLEARAYYVSRNSTGHTGYPALRRKTLQGGPATGPSVGDEEIMPGVEDLQVQFGIDPGVDDDGDGIADRYTGEVSRYVDPGEPALDNAAVVAVRVWIRVRSEAPENGYIDNSTYEYADVSFHPAASQSGYRRLVASRLIHLRNMPGLP